MDYLYPKNKHQVHFYYSNLISDTTFARYSSWEYFKLIPETRPIINPPQVKTVYIEVPGYNGKLDFSDANAGRPHYGQRSGSLNFIWSGEAPLNMSYSANLRKDLEICLRGVFNGRMFNVVLDDDPRYFYRGRVQFNNIEVDNSGDGGNKVILDYNFNPYKYNINCMTNPNKPIEVVNKSSTIDAFYSKYLDSETVSINIPMRVAQSTLYIYTTGGDLVYNFGTPSKVAYNNYQELLPGLTKVSKPLYVGMNTLTISGTGNVIVNYIEGRL